MSAVIPRECFLSPHADMHAGDILFTVFLFICPQDFWYRISQASARKFSRMVGLGVYQVISPFGELWSRVTPPPRSQK